MKDVAVPFAESEIPVFDVFVKTPPNTSFEEVTRTLALSGLPSDQVERLLAALRNGPQVKIGGGVSQERADKAKSVYRAAGLVVVISPVLVLQTKIEGAFNALFVCPACSERVMLPPSRQCPHCGVFVDKVTEAFLLKRKIMQQERAKLTYQSDRDTQDSLKMSRQAMEAAIRAEVRKELEAESGRSEGAHFLSGKAGLLRLAGMFSLLVMAFAGGNAMSQAAWPWSNSDSILNFKKTVGVNPLMDKTGSGKAGVTEATSIAGEQDIEDLLTTSGSNGNGKGLTLDQALAAANTLGKSLGNTTAERAWTGAVSPSVAGPAGNSSLALFPIQKIPALPASPETLWILTVEFARQLAELGQWQRAQDVLRSLKATPNFNVTPEVASGIRLADLEVRAWALGAVGKDRVGKAIEALQSATNLPDPAERVHAMGRVGVILSHQAPSQAASSRAFIAQAGDALKSVADVSLREKLHGDWMVFMGEAYVAEVASLAKSGQWKKAKLGSSALDSLIQQAPQGPAKARLHAIQSRMRQQLGEADQSRESLARALSMAAAETSLPGRAVLLRAIAKLSGAAALEPVQLAVRSLVAQLGSQSGVDKGKALTQLALLQADAGLNARAEEYRRVAVETGGVSPAELAVIQSELMFRTNLAVASLMHSQGRYAESELVWQGLATYLFST